MRVFVCTAAVAAMWAVCVPASCVTIEPGVYKMEWRIPPRQEVMFANRRVATLRPVTTEGPQFKGLVSEKALFGQDAGYTVVFDESVGTDKGYDTAYVFETTSEQADYDVAKAIRIKLRQESSRFVGEEDLNRTVDITVGPEGPRTSRKAVLDVEAYLSRPDQTPKMNYAFLILRGGWYGKLETDEGELPAQLVDMNSDGVYNDQLSVTDSGYPEVGDMVLLGKEPRSFRDYANVIYLAKTALYRGKLYEFDVGPTGETVEVRHYAGPTGHLAFQAVDGAGRPADLEMAMIFGDPPGLFPIQGSESAEVPPGDYKILAAMLMPKGSKDGESAFGLMLRSDKKIKVAKGGHAVMKIGGPIKARIEPMRTTVTAKRGSKLALNLDFTVGGAKLSGIEGNRKAHINIRNSKGKLLSSGQTGFG